MVSLGHKASKGQKVLSAKVAEFSTSAGSYVEMIRIVETLVKAVFFVDAVPTSGGYPDLRTTVENVHDGRKLDTFDALATSGHCNQGC